MLNSIRTENTLLSPVPTAAVQDRTVYWTLKRGFDVLCALLGLLLLSPLFFAIAVLIKLDSPGPIFFVQTRVGSRRRREHGHWVWEPVHFPFYKFRSMQHNADPSLHEAHVRAFVQGELCGTPTNGAKFKLQDDPRVTRVGRILRRTSLDELPQLWNVLRGDMSLVGPRPVPTYEVEHYQSAHHERLCAVPGITGLWQVKGRCDVSFHEMIALDIEYVRRASFALDLDILLLTLPAILSGRGAG